MGWQQPGMCGLTWPLVMPLFIETAERVGGERTPEPMKRPEHCAAIIAAISEDCQPPIRSPETDDHSEACRDKTPSSG